MLSVITFKYGYEIFRFKRKEIMSKYQLSKNLACTSGISPAQYQRISQCFHTVQTTLLLVPHRKQGCACTHTPALPTEVGLQAAAET